MISIIVPVYNVEPYLRKCLDSIVGQTYLDLEILLIDDGSTDYSGKICEEYAELDERIKFFHTENQGLSAARNLGLDYAKGEYIGFVDSDDWIESDMYEVLLKRAEETEADVAECGIFVEHPERTEIIARQNKVIDGKEALARLLSNSLLSAIWNRLWKRECFASIHFPENRVYEDIATTYRVFCDINCVCIVSEEKYHWLQREKSLSKKRAIYNLEGYWLSYRERYEFLQDHVDENIKAELLRSCAEAAARTWSNYFNCNIEERNSAGSFLCEIHLFTKKYTPLFGRDGWELRLKLGILFPHYLNAFSLRTAWLLDLFYKRVIMSFVPDRGAT